MKTLLSSGDSNTKLSKSEKSGEFLALGLSLAPADSSGYQTCPHASDGCRAACLFKQGRAHIWRTIPQSRIEKTRLYFENRQWFLAKLRKEIGNANLRAKKAGKRLCVRLNMFSDIPWERICPKLFDEFPDVQFYDYTKNPKRAGQLRPNYWVTFSRSECNEEACLSTLKSGRNVSVVFSGPIPETWNGYRVINGDETDLRFTDPRGVVVGLKLKAATGSTKKSAITSGFAV